jgi:hypothetical protein
MAHAIVGSDGLPRFAIGAALLDIGHLLVTQDKAHLVGVGLRGLSQVGHNAVAAVLASSRFLPGRRLLLRHEGA